MSFGPKIARYILGAIGPYILFSWLLLSVVLFIQQAGKFYEIFFSVNLPSGLVWQLASALLPSVIAFTCPMAVLVGTIIGLSRMQGDSELVAMRAAGIGNVQIVAPIALLGLGLSIFALVVNIYGVPAAAGAVRNIAIRAAILKLESPIEPGTFNTELAGFTIYAGRGDTATGEWRDLFIYAEDPKTGDVRLITSSGGRIDSSYENSELVLEEARAITLGKGTEGEKVTAENLGDIRIAIRTRRSELIERLNSAELSPQELGIGELVDYASANDGAERREAEVLVQRRLLLSFAPLIFAFLGAGMVLRFNRGGRGVGIFLALVTLLGFYLLSMIAEQFARAGTLPVVSASLLPLLASIGVVIWLFASQRMAGSGLRFERLGELMPTGIFERKGVQRSSILMDLTTGLRDFDIFSNLLKYFGITLAFLSVLFFVFTAFELWRFAAGKSGGFLLLGKYLFFLAPFVFLQIAPSAAMLAILATYVIKSRQNEIVAWIGSGQSIYRLLLPAIIFTLFLGVLLLLLSDNITPRANKIQEDLRRQLRETSTRVVSAGRVWVIDQDRVISFRHNTGASDNGVSEIYDGNSTRSLPDAFLLVRGKEGGAQTLYRSDLANWNGSELSSQSEWKILEIGANGQIRQGSSAESFGLLVDPVLGTVRKPSEMTLSEISQQSGVSRAESEKRSLAVAYHKRIGLLFLPVVVAFFTAPFAISLGRKGKVVSVGYAVAVWLVFMGISAAFEQLGLNGSIPALLSIWAPMLLFAAAGLFLLSRVRT
ncbi:MAG: LptF/LptG family permease [Acidobacteria bacterium]|nr:LptF/LptG family permease [Acidobacteriota bacterium]